MKDYQSFSDKKLSRRNFLKLGASGAAYLASSSCLLKKVWAEPAAPNQRQTALSRGNYDLVEVKGADPYTLTVKAIEAMGGMEKFVKKDGVVLLKPNIAWDRTPQQAANTNPLVVGTLIELCYKAGAKRVNIFDVTCNNEKSSYDNSGIQKIAKEKGAYVYFPDHWNVIKARFSYESPLEGWPIIRDALKCDTFINAPILKHHRLTKLSLSMKNLMGVCSGNRGKMHPGIGRKLVDLTDFINPDLTVIDAYRVLMKNGPVGGNLEDVVKKETLFVATNPTLADSYACTFVDQDPLSVPYIAEAIKRNFGNADINKANILKMTA